ncbi:DUF4376 domain-containing protein [Chitiniphilus purpureus]|uniref:DUF4376 domain-containing protein n=1 Tax=Chitiniphilus purpureus TaxID=2981137 RepID=A0ABY6DHQ8_9NEIS|nr:DUF4376 domain-containing protein [Chitiniphilus sp. CD1]UXY13874.1 DUF4376 domain-containing protein [Chitiniphilus sp. CD1]
MPQRTRPYQTLIAHFADGTFALQHRPITEILDDAGNIIGATEGQLQPIDASDQATLDALWGYLTTAAVYEKEQALAQLAAAQQQIATLETSVQALTAERDSLLAQLGQSTGGGNQPSTREQLAAAIAAERYRRETAGTTVDLGGGPAPLLTDRSAIGVLIGAIVHGDRKGIWPAAWKFGDGVFRAVTPAALDAMADACHAHVSAAFEWEAAEVARLAATPDNALAEFTIGV